MSLLSLKQCANMVNYQSWTLYHMPTSFTCYACIVWLCRIEKVYEVVSAEIRSYIHFSFIVCVCAFFLKTFIVRLSIRGKKILFSQRSLFLIKKKNVIICLSAICSCQAINSILFSLYSIQVFRFNLNRTKYEVFSLCCSHSSAFLIDLTSL